MKVAGRVHDPSSEPTAAGAAPRSWASRGAPLACTLLLACHEGGSTEPRGADTDRAAAAGCTIRCEEIWYESRTVDQVPPLDSPAAASPDAVVDIDPRDIVVGVHAFGAARAYPLRVLARHEVVNDSLGSGRVAVVHSPLAGATTAVDLEATGVASGFGNSGGLYNGEVILYDRDTTSLWSAMRREAVSGDRRGRRMTIVPSVRTTLAAWVASHPDTTVVTTDTGHDQIDYDGDPYAWYAADPDRLLSPVRFLDLRLGRKEPVLGVSAGGHNRAYAGRALGDRAVLNDSVGGEPVVVVADRGSELLLSHVRRAGGRVLEFELASDDGAGPVRLRDRATGSEWTADGRAVSGPLVGARLAPAQGQLAYWFAWAAFHPGTEIWTSEPGGPALATR